MKPKNRGDQLRFAIVGAGRIAGAYAQAFAVASNARLVAVADNNPAAAEALAAKAGCLFYNSHQDLLERNDIDAVVVSTPPLTHGPIAIDFLTQGIPVLCEKPVSIDPETARKIQQVSLEKRVPFTMASKFRYAEDVVRAHHIVSSNILGDIVLFENTFMSYVDMSNRWNADPAVSGGGVLIDNGTHSVDIMRYFLGPLMSIHAVTGIAVQNLPVEDTVYVTARSDSGATGRMDLSWSINKQCDDFIAIYGCKGTLRVGWKGSFYRQENSASWVQLGKGYDKVQAFRDQIENFSAAVQGLERLVIDASDAVASVDAITAGYRAIEEEVWIPIGADRTAVSHAAA